LPSPNLRVTERCLTGDLGLKRDLVERDARDFADSHAAVKKFVTMREADPAGGEPTYGLYKRGLIRSLHVGSARAVTTWDDVEDVCWLLAYDDYHRNGEPDDAYAYFNDLYSVGRLMPTGEDYDAILLDTSEDWIERFFEAGIRLLERARGHPGSDEFETWEDGGRQVICVDMVVEGDESAEEGWMGVTLPDDVTLTDEQVYELVAGLIPDSATPLYCDRFKDRERRRGEIVYRWEFYQGGAE
jgi:hypothetical protein